MTSVKVAVRVRPLNRRELNMESKFIIGMEGKKTKITNIKIPEGPTEGETSRESYRTKEFTFDFSFWTVDKEDTARYHSQETVYQSLGQDVVQSAYEGYNACVFAYGQTGSGKTYTMMGPHDDPGLIPRICQELFSRMTEDSTSYRTEVSYLEIYNEKVRDLLKSTGHNKVAHTLRVREHPKEGPYVQGLSKFIIGSYQEIEGLMQKGNNVRTTASTSMNDVSSRSHAIFTIVFTQATLRDGIPSEKTSKIHLVDLAGSERATATGATGVRLREGGSINKSLVSLGTVISQLAEVSEKGLKPGKHQFIPYRDSTLTWLLKDSLGGNSRTIMVTTISPADVNYAETLSALRYANRAKNIINRPTVNEDPNVKIIRELREEIDRLRTMIGGNIDSISTPRVKERLHESEARFKVLTAEWTEKWKEAANILQEQETLALRKEGLGVVLDSALPHLIGIDDDILSTGIMLYHLKEGKTRIGRSDAENPPDIVIAGQEVEADHCVIENQQGTVTLVPVQEALCAVNGSLAAEPVKLTQGAVILLGRTNMFRYNNPAEAEKMKKEMKKSGMTLSLSRTSLLSQSMTDLYRSSENLSAGGGWEMDQSHREEQEKIEELRQELKVMEDRYHEAEEERINKQVAMEMELEKKQTSLFQAQQEIEKFHEEVSKKQQNGDVMMKLPKGHQIEEMLQKLDEKESEIVETAESTKQSLLQEIKNLQLKNEEEKQSGMEKVEKLKEKMAEKEKHLEELVAEQRTRQDLTQQHIAQEQQNIEKEEDLLHRVQTDFDSLLQSQLEGNESLNVKWQELETENKSVLDEIEKSEAEIRDKWKSKIDEIAEENTSIEEAWKDLAEQELFYDAQLKSESLSDTEKAEVLSGKEELQQARTLLKEEEEKVAGQERQVLDDIEKEMDKWEQLKQEELTVVREKQADIVRQCGSSDLNELAETLNSKALILSESRKRIQVLETEDLEKEQACVIRRKEVLEERSQIQTQCDTAQQELTLSRESLELSIASTNSQISEVQVRLQEELEEVEEERQRLRLLRDATIKTTSSGVQGDDDITSSFDTSNLSAEEREKLEQKKKEVEELQAKVERAQEELDEKVRNFDAERDYELDTIELEKVTLQERVRQDRINALVEQEVKRRMFEEKVQREHVRQVERDREKLEREEEIKRLKDAHLREIKQLKARYEKRSSSFGKTMAPSKSNPYVTVMSSDSDGDVLRRKSTGSLTNSMNQELPPSIHITIPSYRLQCYGSDSHYEYEVKVVIGDDIWTVSRRYSKFRQFHQDLKARIPEVGALVFPPKKWFSKTEKVAAERQRQLEFYLCSVVEICTKIPSCQLHSSQNQFLSKQVLCDFDSFFRKGLFETTKHGTS